MKSVIITGGGSGLGAALAEEYAKKYKVILIGRTLKKLTMVKDVLMQRGQQADCYACDVTSMEEVKHVFGQLFQREDIHMLINNAGSGIFGPLEKFTEEEVDLLLDTNVKGTLFTTMAALPYLKEKSEGKIMNVISTAGLRGKVNESVYCASKFAVRGFTESLVKELDGTGISVTAVYMGGMDTPFWEASDHVKDKSRFKTPQQVAVQIVSEDNGKAEIFIDR
ncbi:SDR family NAD(P)-dependent oxidoreductase [Fictibacillus fluitans]|uniref:SDR family NAD(P)-dependent oxidoreductase n=1 Tax=Fictibacillus fluitans TaxID=3058422 RepID=A0ABT8I3H2_9BACL|nr:SDR family NAD(P)-dependent oxidoreductase [Fictibacillus sp. NE201]MDN4527577.1 SDR family NAD(P)-dependent oxidoreductase [Fictibacillus sp. NE201]